MPLLRLNKSFMLPGVLALSLLATAQAQTEEPHHLAPAQGGIDIIETLPDGLGPFPVVVLAPGQAYSMRMPLLAELAKSLPQQGIAVIRFDWRYFTRDPQQGEPSADLAAEAADLRAALDFAAKDKRLDAKRRLVAGKSLGSLVAWQVLRAEPSIAAGLMLTPVCSEPGDAGVPKPVMDENYPGLAAELRPLAFISGDIDPNCYSPVLYRYAASAGRTVRVDVVGGNHGFLVGKPGDAATAAAGRRNLAMAVQNATDFAVQALVPK